MRAFSRADIPQVRAFSLVEILATVATMAVIAAVAIPAVGRILDNSKGVKLENDVADLNKAIKVYLANGGSLDGVTTAEAVLYKLKTQRSDADSETYAGLRSSMIDKRLSASVTSDAESASGVTRAIWNSVEQRFVLSNSGGSGVREFILDETLASFDFGSEERENSTVAYTSDDRGWIWNYEDAEVTRPSGPTQITLVAGSSSGSGGSSGGSYGSGGTGDESEGTGGIALALGSGDADSSDGGIALATGGAESTSDDGIALGTNVSAIVVDEGVALATPIISAELLTEDSLLSLDGGSTTASSGGSTATAGSEAEVEDASATGEIAGAVSLLNDASADGGLIGAGVSGTGDGSSDADLIGAALSGTGDATTESDFLGLAVSGTGDADASGEPAIDEGIVSSVYRLLGR